jgi:hypothetical protein
MTLVYSVNNLVVTDSFGRVTTVTATVTITLT